MKQFLAVLVMGFYLVACGESYTDAQYLEKAQTNFDRGDVKLAVIDAKNALKLNPDNGQARVLLGKLQLLSGNASAAEKEFSIAAKLGVPEELFQAELSHALLLQGKRGEVQALSPGKLAGTGKAEFLANQGLAFLSDNDLGQANQMIDRALSIAPDSVPALLAKARLHLVSRELEQARAVLEKVQSFNDEEQAAWSLLGDVERQSGNLEAAVASFSKAIDSGGQGFYDRLKRAEAFILLKQFDLAQKDVNVLLKHVPNSPMVNYAAGQLQVFAENIDDAQASFEKVVRVRDDFAPALYALTMIHFQKGNYGLAEQYANQFNNQKPDSPHGQRLLAMVQYRNQKYAEAESQLRGLLSANPNDPAALNLLASAVHRQGKTAESVILLKKLAKDFPDSAYAQLRLGAGLLSAGDKDAGEARMEQAIALNPEFHQADVLLALHHLQQNDFEKSLSLASAYRDKNPESALPHNLIGQSYLGQKNWSAARAAFNKAMALQPGDIASNHAMALLAVRDKNLDEARGYYQSILEHHDNHLRSLMRLAALDALENKQKPMLATLERAREAHPESLSPRLVMARYWITQKQYQRVEPLFQGLEKKVDGNPDVLSVVAVAQLAQQEYANARLNLERLDTLKPDSPKVKYLLARAYAGEKRLDKMQASLNQALDLRPNYFDARLALARYLVSVDAEKAQRHIEQLKVSAPDRADVQRLDALVQNRLGDPNKALLLYQKAFDEKPETANVLLLARQHVYMKNREQAVGLLEGWLQQQPEDVSARTLLANEYIALEKPSEVVAAQYQKILDQQPDNLLAMNNLAWHLRDIDLRAALDHAKKALQARPGSAVILDTVAVLELKNGDVNAAQRAIRQAKRISPENPNVIYHTALIEMAAGDIFAAHELLTNLLQDADEFQFREEAQALLDSLK